MYTEYTESTTSTSQPENHLPPTRNLSAGQKPGQLYVIRRNSTITPYEDNKIRIAITKAFLAVEGGQAAASDRIHQTVNDITQQITETFHRRMPGGGTMHIEDIQDQVELALMRSGAHKVARSYVLYREEHRKIREQTQATQIKKTISTLQVTLDDGQKVPLNEAYLTRLVTESCEGLSDVEPTKIIKDTLSSLYDGVPMGDVRKALIMSVRPLIEKDPNYSYVAARLLLNDCRAEALSFLNIQDSIMQSEAGQMYPHYFEKYLERGIALELLSPKLREFDLAQLGQALKPERDQQFTYLGLQTLYDRYFIHYREKRFELPQAFFMRVAMGLAMSEADKNARAIEFYNLLSSFDFMSSTPTLFNSGTLRPQLSSCYLSTVPDNLAGIYDAIKDNALLSKYAGGLGNDWTPVRAMNSHIKGTNGKSQGVVPFLKVANDTAVAVNQGGKRKGALCSYLETWHLDIEEFIELRKNTGDERRRTHDMNTANWIPDLFMQRLVEDKDWTLFSPNETPDLHDLYGKAFEEAYVAYEVKAKRGEIHTYKTLPAKQLWRKMLSMVFETGHPWVTFKDPCNIRSPQQHVGVVHSSNLCTEITLNTSEEEIAVCNLGSVNLPAHMNKNGLDLEKLERTVKTAIRMLDNVIDVNYYSVPQARRSNLKHRPIGLGIMGFQDALYKQSTPYASQEAVEFADRSMEAISYFAIKASSDLAQERGAYATYEGSLWSQGILPIDSIQGLIKERGIKYIDQNQSKTLDWDRLRTRVQTVGMRNSNVLAIAPTATIANITGVCQSIEPTYQNLYVKSNLSGEFTVVNPYLVDQLKAHKLWDDVMVNDLKFYNGRINQISRIPQSIRQLFATSFEIDPKWLVEAGSRRQKWIDQSQSLNLYMAEPSGKKLDDLYRLAWHRGLKTTYYLRSLGATTAEKSTLHNSALNAVKPALNGSVASMDDAPKACSIEDPDCEACQ